MRITEGGEERHDAPNKSLSWKLIFVLCTAIGGCRPTAVLNGLLMDGVSSDRWGCIVFTQLGGKVALQVLCKVRAYHFALGISRDYQ